LYGLLPVGATEFGREPFMQSKMSPKIAPTMLGLPGMLLRQGIDTFWSAGVTEFMVSYIMALLAFTNVDVDVTGVIVVVETPLT
jgi:hypothetical protein